MRETFADKLKKKKIEGILKILCKFKQEPYKDSDCSKCVFHKDCYFRNVANEIYNYLMNDSEPSEKKGVTNNESNILR